MELEFDITRDELYRATKLIGQSAFREFKSTWTYRLLAGLSIAVVLGLGVSAVTFLHRSVFYDYFSFLIILILIAGYTFLFRAITAEFYKYIVFNSIRFTGPVKMKVVDDSVFVQEGGITSQFMWEAFRKAEDTKEFLLLYIDIHQAVVVPKKGEKSGEFVALLCEKVKPVAKFTGYPARP